MRNSASYVLAALILAALAGLLATGASLERQIAEAQADLAVANLADAERGYSAVWNRITGAGWLSWLLAGTQHEVEAQRAAIRYWRGDYAGLLADYARQTDQQIHANIPLRLAVANAAYRAGQRENATPADMLHGLDQAIDLYTQLLQDAGGRHDLAFNYEFLVTLRDAIGRGRSWTPRSSENPLGQEGGQPLTEDTELDDVEIFVPMYHDERDPTDEPTRGTDPPIQRRG